ncbi:MAG: 50S ribosomal protein L6 [Candidatus Woesebacteria bacterium GW2011_GWC2_47_16]|uniref:Large ribosomal subunit protein uL6 n=8 Tax=Candidatus Woeseibacteriota TaxID=1752722 RepID=A0A0G1TNQ5_9BACT|nr:MAG: 50S ribosomal protein L6 [Candidatus Woesebacteria bacterium GW2011_GWE1_45_18]KKU23847.1 MAG: 50S ribosomal protein L6 [Candidatus Woesebacteria bacterium GW2011_GWF1_46_13]KKU46985.1 MAG: 50S ribosomal protein L6 [Candidatus Woesebacteria bacterium GW2011_GWF2_46_8]KKU64487.1 MAG: 50S ribosomal protein L6 [Candidatus Woesebacteria bacterium GW2011_GWC2_47_16]KKU70815.1 MAG: 50S ribosomal protein L6 [Candidatus Woesebacteria bacterium GW2011_GWD1_47_21]OGM78787.1 MAG: 50S ribosomal pr
MSKIGKQPIILPEGVEAEATGNAVTVKGPNGNLTKKFSREVVIEVTDGKILVSVTGKNKRSMSVWGGARSIIWGMVEGVSQGWKKQLELVGTGYRAEISGQTLVLTVGYSHPVTIEAPEGITLTVEKSVITVSGADKEMVGQIAANIRAVRPPEPYKGKGIKYLDEVVRRKAGKAAKTVGAPTG